MPFRDGAGAGYGNRTGSASSSGPTGAGGTAGISGELGAGLSSGVPEEFVGAGDTSRRTQQRAEPLTCSLGNPKSFTIHLHMITSAQKGGARRAYDYRSRSHRGVFTSLVAINGWSARRGGLGR